ncbi:hypothetical protein BCR44DRAFT_45260 [Catenaria anguillulae PL171]|uniref:MPN domain-containing protein n=1 Tax=Catenaria anguillulae PL171 TaxID=765915 RepID=A0A1Y2HIG9_9FUNG|nr:hypothetical protein BCR44DRAFT_45260 [Catenaria anguillulae PL171]
MHTDSERNPINTTMFATQHQAPPATLNLGKLSSGALAAGTASGSSASAAAAAAAAAAPSAASHALTHPTSASLSARVHLVALLSILDHWTHRSEDSSRVVGALLGTRSADGRSMQITDAFPIVLLDQDTSIDVDFATSMYQLRRRTNTKEVVLGWYSTGTQLDDTTSALHDWVETNLIAGAVNQGSSSASSSSSAAAPTSTASAIHLLVDTSLQTDSMPVLGFLGTPVNSLNDGVQGRMFLPLPVQVAPADHELSGLEAIATAALPSNNNTAEIVPRVGIPQAHGRIAKLESLVDGCIALAQDTLEALMAGEVTSPAHAAEINRLGHALRKVVQTRTYEKDVKVLETEIRDLKTVLDLAGQARKQIQLSELIMYGAAYKH